MCYHVGFFNPQRDNHISELLWMNLVSKHAGKKYCPETEKLCKWAGKLSLGMLGKSYGMGEMQWLQIFQIKRNSGDHSLPSRVVTDNASWVVWTGVRAREKQAIRFLHHTSMSFSLTKIQSHIKAFLKKMQMSLKTAICNVTLKSKMNGHVGEGHGINR